MKNKKWMKFSDGREDHEEEDPRITRSNPNDAKFGIRYFLAVLDFWGELNVGA